VTEKVDALVAGLVHARLELLAAKFTAAKKQCISQLVFKTSIKKFIYFLIHYIS
jgi:hypothetical protein